MKISEMLSKKMVLFLETSHMNDTIEKMVEAAYKNKNIENKEDFMEAILKREEIVSTGIGLGAAIPHAKLDTIKEFFLVVAVIKAGVDWDSIDRKPVNTVFLIGGPDENQGEYLKMLAKITLIVKNPEKREKLMNATTAQEIVDVFEKY